MECISLILIYQIRAFAIARVSITLARTLPNSSQIQVLLEMKYIAVPNESSKIKILEIKTLEIKTLEIKTLEKT